MPPDEADEQADRAATDHDDGLAGRHLTSARVVAGDRQRLGERGQVQVEAGRQLVDRERGHGPRLLEGAGAVDPHELQVAREMAEALVRGHLAACVERTDDDGVAGLEAGDVRADLGDGARHLVADHLRSTDPPVHVRVRDVEVGATDAAVGDVEPHLARAGRQTVGLADREPALALVVDRGHSAVSPPERTARASSFSISSRSHCSPSERWIRSAALARSASRLRSAR